MVPDQRLDAPGQRLVLALLARLELLSEVAAVAPALVDDRTAERPLQPLIAGQPDLDAMRGDGIGEAGGIQRALGGAGAGMRTHQEGGIAEQRDAAEHDPRSVEVE